MKKQYLELVGLLVVNSTTIKMYHIDYLYKIDLDGSLTGDVVQRGFDWALHIPFWDIVCALGDAYAPVLEKRWTRWTERSLAVFMSFKHGQTPASAGLGDGWGLECQR